MFLNLDVTIDNKILNNKIQLYKIFSLKNIKINKIAFSLKIYLFIIFIFLIIINILINHTVMLKYYNKINSEINSEINDNFGNIIHFLQSRNQSLKKLNISKFYFENIFKQFIIGLCMYFIYNFILLIENKKFNDDFNIIYLFSFCISIIILFFELLLHYSLDVVIVLDKSNDILISFILYIVNIVLYIFCLFKIYEFGSDIIIKINKRIKKKFPNINILDILNQYHQENLKI